MQKYLFSCILVIGLLIMFIPISSAHLLQPLNSPKVFKNCYLEATGELTKKDFPSIIGTNMWKMCFFRPDKINTDYAFIFYWFIRYAENAEICIYTEPNGELLWQHDGTGVQQLRILWFQGTYIPSEIIPGSLTVDISGTIRSIQIIEK